MTSNRMSCADARLIKLRTASSTARSMDEAACSMARFNSPARASATGLTCNSDSLSKGDATLSNNSKVLTTTKGGASLEFKSSMAVARAWASSTCWRSATTTHSWSCSHSTEHDVDPYLRTLGSKGLLEIVSTKSSKAQPTLVRDIEFV